MTGTGGSQLHLTQQPKRGQPPPAVSYGSLLAKSKLHVRKSLDAKEAGEDIDYQLWAATALELLAKARLSKIHASLVVETDNTNSLLEACGFNTGTVIRTISASTAYARLKHTVPHFSTPVHEECKKLAERRNAELHSGEAACSSIPKEAWEGNFWNAADLILSSMDLDLEEWLGADAAAQTVVLNQYRQAQKQLAIQRIAHHAGLFQKPGKAKFDALVAQTYSQDPESCPTKFRYLYVRYWRQLCPSCKTYGVAAGDESWEDEAEDQSGIEYGYRLVEHAYTPSEFYCPQCDLLLVGEEAMAVAEIGEEILSEVEEIEYEPDYGND